jgi:hypothetical protein
MTTHSNLVLRLAAAGIAALLCTAASAQIFECIDANGKREFTQKCEPGTVKQREVAKTRPGELDVTAQPQTSYKEEEQAFRRRQLDREASEAKAAAAAAQAEKKCQGARAHLASIESARRVFAGNDPKTGERRFLDDAERAAATQKARDSVAANCK